MPGIFVSNEYELSVANDYSYYSYNENRIKLDQYYVFRKVINKFENDKLFVNTDDFFVFTDGVCLNKAELETFYGTKVFSDIIIRLYLDYGETFPQKLRGSFSGAIFDKHTKEWLIYTNHTGTKPIFIYQQGESWIISSSLCYIADNLKHYGVKLNLDHQAAYNLLSYGFMIADATLISEVRRLTPGHFVKITADDKITIKPYFQLSNTPMDEFDIDGTGDIINDLFCTAVKREYEKDEEYGYTHFCQLSGGLDSRLAMWVANKKLGHDDIVAGCFSQSNTLDQTISQKIASDLHIEYLFKNLDDARFIKSLEESIYLNYGLCCASGQLHEIQLEKCLNYERFGLRHTGQIGDVILGSFCADESAYKPITAPTGQNSNFLIEKAETDFSAWENKELFMLYNRAFNGALCSDFIRDTASPFIDVDFMSFCLHIPTKYRQKGGGVYANLLTRMYPEACKYKWETTNNYVNASKLSVLFSKARRYGFKFTAAKILKRFLKVDIRISHGRDWMNPFDYWYENIQDIREFIDNYFFDNIDKIQINDNLRRDMKLMFANVSAREKLQILTLIMSIKYYF